MTKKKRKSKDERPAESFEHKVQDAFKKINLDTDENESVEDQADLKEVSAAEEESVEDKAGSAETAAAAPVGVEAAVDASTPESGEQSQPQAAAAAEDSVDDLLDDVRRSLIEDDAQSEDKKPGWLSRIAKGFQKDQPSTESQVEPVEEEAIPLVPDVPTEPPQDDQYLDEIDELLEMLEPEESVGEPQPEPVQIIEAAPQPEPEPPVDVEALKKRVFSPREGAEEQEITEVRAVVLEGEGGEEVFVEVEARKEDAAQERRKAFENALRPYRRYLYFVTAFLGIVVIVVVLALMAPAIYNSALFSSLRQSRPTPTVTNLPYPVGMTLPGGLNFKLGRGAINDGQWNPVGPEWLAGTEICRWVAIPWSLQLEAVVRTLTQEDSIELVMSNNDRLSYNVFSIQELTLEEMQSLDQNSPCLLLVLAEQETEKRWVVTAKP
jgi:hypothetical protein